MAVIRGMAIIPKDSGVPRDASVNVWHFDCPAADGVTMGLLTAALSTFYNSIASIYSSAVNPAAAKVKYYNMLDPKPRPPIGEYPLTITNATGSSSAAPELCICLSFQGPRVAGEIQARRRGRVYLGPLGFTGIGTTEVVTSAAVNSIVSAAVALQNASDASGQWSWVVLSQVAAELTTTVVTEGWVDNAFDVQRRRGIEATIRSTWT